MIIITIIITTIIILSSVVILVIIIIVSIIIIVMIILREPPGGTRGAPQGQLPHAGLAAREERRAELQDEDAAVDPVLLHRGLGDHEG